MRDDAPFGYATMVTSDGTYKGLTFGRSTSVYFDDNSVIVQPSVAYEYLEAMRQEQESIKPMPNVQTGNPNSNSSPLNDDPIALPDNKNRYYGSVRLNPNRVIKDVGVIVEELIERLNSPNTEFEIRLEITAIKSDGFDENTIRTAKENSRTLKFDNFDFEED